MPPPPPDDAPYYTILTAAVNDIAEHGYDSVERLNYWQMRLRMAAERMIRSPAEMEGMLREALESIYARQTEPGRVDRVVAGSSRFTLANVAPHLRAELDRRILAGADLIRLNREEAIRKTLQRFSGWATSVPPGGVGDDFKRRKKKDEVRKSLRSLPFEERRVLIDQGHKLTAAINETVAGDAGAVAGRWHSHWRERGYDYRPAHKARDGQVYLVRGSWAHKRGLVVPGAGGYVDEVTRPAEEPFCRCRYDWIFAIGRLPKEMITKKGHEELTRARSLMREANRAPGSR